MPRQYFFCDCINDFVKVTGLVGANDGDDSLGTLCLEKLRRALVWKAAFNECTILKRTPQERGRWFPE